MFDINRMLSNVDSSPVFMIAEIGINHDGNINIAKKMIDAASEAKADAVKFQIYNLDGFYNKKIDPNTYRLFESFHISLDDFTILKKYAEKKGMLAFATPLDENSLLYFIKEQIFPIKIASGDAGTEPWIDLLLEKNIPFIISTGSLEDNEIKTLASKIQNSLSAMLYCVSEYPAPPEGFDIRYIQKMQSFLPNQPIGFSDHSQGIALSLAAISLGAKIIERHFTIFPERSDYDHPVSLSPEQFYDLVSSTRMIESALGKGNRITTPLERKIKSLAGRDAYASRLIPANTQITEQDIVFQRPGSGISSEQYKKMLGKKHHSDIQIGDRLLDIFSI